MKYHITVNSKTKKVTGVWQGNPNGTMEIVNGLWEGRFLNGRLEEFVFDPFPITENIKDNFTVFPVQLESELYDYNLLMEMADEIVKGYQNEQ